MEIEELQNLLKMVKEIPFAAPPEANLFTVGARGHFENPTSDLLAFFLNPAGAHQLGELALAALAECIPEEQQVSDFFLKGEPLREIPTDKGNRIDILLESQNWVMVIENKIFHDQNNPFDDYEDCIKQRYGEKDTRLFIVLSPSGQSPSGWTGVSYSNLLSKLSGKLAETFMSQPLNKWVILLREFILHLEALMNNPVVPEAVTDFVLEHLDDIHRTQNLKNQVITALRDESLRYLQPYFEDSDVVAKIEDWEGFPAISLSLQKWEGFARAVLFLNGRKGEQYLLQYYAHRLKNDEQRNIAQELLKSNDCIKVWFERSNTTACFTSTLPSYRKEEMFNAVKGKLRLSYR
ncbi:PD-(D/E)XK nuclease family protein [Endozoicomonas sp. SCSIO W0465]|uniref:PDDEXK-like family protein n=1 Tax=Endozoicomonas sp. SCSIO W0465 TaxID=2918516 RepID=UPI00207587B8|nr:PD-(D/E)XK nuclease family protein [Endozoicomonas sp. SCSIO W0465]USE35007.1 PD-(D/E)XK nuclease family protein [Endozoicomonas sp. SCSIO W0465]